ncbi:thioredoxin family protein [Aurantimonas sp. VKM B-3413]|uniref:thioredoxin family protein n=1 Tax=Aurantimonas sp. VKM B-3413 TaxID=2779401 RepID=UPI001E642A10|nr:thioredoxin family protein [Aurantimonas sp. VKM B-3413]MCB8837204.1 thioredoxin family protein [Aurantimonas sp. VKM B-3413]
MLKALAFAVGLTAMAAGAAPAAELGDDGLHKEDWFQLTFRDVGEDIRAADEEGKRLAIVFEQRGCIYCKKMHEELLSDPEVRDYIRANFMVVQYNLFGDEEVTDLDGKALTEKSAARRWHVVFTPTILFMPDKVPDGETAADAAVATMPGAFGKQTFLHMFEWVREKGYDTDEHFQKYHARKLAESGGTDD